MKFYLDNIQDDIMDNIPDLYIIGLPVRTEIGILYPLQVIDYPKFVPFIQILNMEDFEFKDTMKISMKESLQSENEPYTEVIDAIFDEIKDIHFFYLLMEQKDNVDSGFNAIYNHYKKLFKMCFRDDVFDLIQNHEEFEYYRDLIREFNGVEYEKPNPNPEIRKFDNYKRLLAARKGDIITFKGMYTSVLVATGMSPNNLTLYQFHEVFDRIGHFKNFDVTMLYRLLDSEMEIQSWYGETKKKEDAVITEEQLQNAKKQGKQGLQSDL